VLIKFNCFNPSELTKRIELLANEEKDYYVILYQQRNKINNNNLGIFKYDY